MNDIELIKLKMKAKRHNRIVSKPEIEKNSNKYINNLITRILLAIILFFSGIIFSNTSTQNKKILENTLFEKNISFTKISNLYNRYFGTVLPIKSTGTDANTVFNEQFTYEDINEYKDGYSLTVTENYLIPIIESGIVVFSGEKEGYGNTLIIQGIDEIDYWYSNIQNISVELYDYVTKGTLLGTSIGSKMYLTFHRNGEYLGYDEIFQ